jgi:hypothetical protein
MNKFIRLWCLLLAAFPAGATTNLYVNSAPLASPPMTAPQIDARAWYNRALFGVTNLLFGNPLPFESQGTLFFTNAPAPAGTMLSDPGFRFLQNTPSGQRLWMDTWENAGVIATDHDTTFNILGLGFVTSIGDSRASILQVEATNITSTGPLLQSGTHGLIRLEGKRVNLAYNALRTGSSTPLGIVRFGGGFIGASNYLNDVGITDLYWATGTNNSTGNQGQPMVIDGTAPQPIFNLPLPLSPQHDIIQLFSGRPFTNSTFIPFGGLLASYTAAAHTNTLSPTSRVVQIVFYPTNSTDPQASTEVRFSPFLGVNGAQVTVAFHSSEFDLATQTYSSNSVYLSDGLATITNVFLARNLAGSTRRPDTYEIGRLTPFSFARGVTNNAVFNPQLIFNDTFLLRAVTNRYAAYSASVDLLSSSPSGSIPYDATNLPGRIEIIGDRVNLDHTRIRAESSLIIKANDLVSNRLAAVDAPIVNFDVRSTQPSLTISNLAPQTVKRFAGQLRAWSGIWENQELVSSGGGTTNLTTNSVIFHVLIVDSDLQSIIPVSVNEFAARATNVVIQDQLNITKSFTVEGNSWDLTGGLSLPFGASLGASNVINVRNFTNDGVIFVTGTESFGTDRPFPYNNYVNRGTNEAAAHFIRTTNFDNSGALIADGGLIAIDTLTANLQGLPLVFSNTVVTNITFDFFTLNLVTNIETVTNFLSQPPFLQGQSDVQINARTMVASNSLINAGRLILSVTNLLTDAGTDAINHWNTTAGFQANRRPTTSQLLGTYLQSTAPRLAQIDHTWAATNSGAVPAGYTNNLAVGKLVLDGGSNSTFRFFGVGNNNALYVDYLELDNFATNVNERLAIAGNFTVYFANANLSVRKLDGAAGGRLRWVPDFTGPLSSTNLTYFFTNGVTITSNTYTFNIALVTDMNLDSDFDGIVNGLDPTPIYVPQNAVLSVSLAEEAFPAVQVRWSALAYSSNFVEYKSAAGDEWRVLTNFHHGESTSPVRLVDPVPTNGAVRVYRLRVDRGPYFY